MCRTSWMIQSSWPPPPPPRPRSLSPPLRGLHRDPAKLAYTWYLLWLLQDCVHVCVCLSKFRPGSVINMSRLLYLGTSPLIPIYMSYWLTCRSNGETWKLPDKKKCSCCVDVRNYVRWLVSHHLKWQQYTRSGLLRSFQYSATLLGMSLNLLTKGTRHLHFQNGNVRIFTHNSQTKLTTNPNLSRTTCAEIEHNLHYN